MKTSFLQILNKEVYDHGSKEKEKEINFF